MRTRGYEPQSEIIRKPHLQGQMRGIAEALLKVPLARGLAASPEAEGLVRHSSGWNGPANGSRPKAHIVHDVCPEWQRPGRHVHKPDVPLSRPLRILGGGAGGSRATA